MSLVDLFLPEWDREMESTHKVLQAVPGDQLTWKPHEKSMALGALASHIANLPWWATITCERNELDFQAPDAQPPREYPKSTQDILNEFERKSAEARARLLP